MSTLFKRKIVQNSLLCFKLFDMKTKKSIEHSMAVKHVVILLRHLCELEGN